VDRSAIRLLDGNTQWTTEMNTSWSAQFYLIDKTGGTLRPQCLQQVQIYQDGVLQFGGFIDQILEVAYEGLTWVQYRVQCLGWSSMCDHRVIVAQYDAGDTAVDVIDDIVANGLSGEGVTINFGAVAFVLMPEPLTLNPSTVTDAFNQIINLIGGQWWIDSNKVLNWSAVGEGAFMAVGISDNDGSWLSGTMQVTTTTADYRNDQYVGTGAPIGTQSSSNTFIGDGHLFSFVVQFPINAAPVITVNGVTQTIYQLGVDAFGKVGWYWSSDSAVVQQGQQIPPTSGSVIVVTYDSFSVSFVEVKDPAAIAAAQALQGGSGIWSNIDQQAGITSASVATTYAQGEVNNYAYIAQSIQFNTYREDFVVGKQINFALSLHNLFGPYTVMEIQATEVPGIVSQIPLAPTATGTMNFQVTVSNQVDTGNYMRWFQLLLAKVTSPTLAAASSVGNSASNGSPPTTPAASGIQSESHVWDLGASDQTGGGGGLVLTGSFAVIAVGRINFINSGNLQRVSVQARVAPVGQNLVLMITRATAAEQTGSPPCLTGDDIFPVHSPQVDADNLVLLAGQCTTAQQTVFASSPWPIVGMDTFTNGSPPVAILPDLFTIWGKYTLTSIASPPVTVNAQDVIVTITEQFS
jgi:hypothetical protein